MLILILLMVLNTSDVESPKPGEDRRLHNAQIRVERVVQNDIRT
jgi:hypothetical protein